MVSSFAEKQYEARITTVTAKGQVTIPKHGTRPPANPFDRFIGFAGPGMTTDEVMAMTRGDD